MGLDYVDWFDVSEDKDHSEPVVNRVTGLDSLKRTNS
jgi:hypothetical protein